MKFVREENGDEWAIGEDSKVFVPKKGDTVTKYYRAGRFLLEDIQRYALLHKHMAGKGYIQVPFDAPSRDLHGLKSENIRVRFLDTGTNIAHDDWGVVHTVSKIVGDVLLGSHSSSFERKIQNGLMFGKYIELEVSDILEQELGINKYLVLSSGLRILHVVGGNIKVESHTDEGIQLCVTDIGADIRRLLDQNKEAIDSLLG